MQDTDRHFPGKRARWALFAFLGLATVLLLVEHRAHLAGLAWLPLALLLLCPLLHVFMHGGHGPRGGTQSDANDGRASSDTTDHGAKGGS